MEKKKLTNYKKHLMEEKRDVLSNENMMKTLLALMKKYPGVVEHLKNV